MYAFHRLQGAYFIGWFRGDLPSRKLKVTSLRLGSVGPRFPDLPRQNAAPAASRFASYVLRFAHPHLSSRNTEHGTRNTKHAPRSNVRLRNDASTRPITPAASPPLPLTRPSGENRGPENDMSASCDRSPAGAAAWRANRGRELYRAWR